MRLQRVVSCLVVLVTTTNAKAPKASLFSYEKDQLSHHDVASFSQQYQSLFDFVEDLNAGPTLPGDCKSFPGDEDWPTEATWATLNEVLGDALVSTIPAAAPCYKNWGIYNEAKCAAITVNFTNPYFHEADPTSNMWPIYQGRTCLPTNDTTRSCTLGAYPIYAANISSVRQIQLALNFARNTNIRLVIKNTGHCYLGKSLGAGALSIWTHNLKNIEFFEDYESESGYKGSAFKVGAGVTLRELYKAAHQYNVTVTGGICESVGFAGGYVAGGGHTPMSGYYGMAADNIEELQVVLANGDFVTASNKSNSDLFWALRGGGGSTYGIVTSVIVRAHPKIAVVISQFTFETGGNVTSEMFWDGLRKFWEMFPVLAEARTYSYFSIAPTANNGTSFTMMPFWAPGHTIQSFNTLVAPWFDYLHTLGINFTPNIRLHDAFYPAYHESWGNETVGTNVRLPGNRIFPRSNWEDPERFNRMWSAIKTHGQRGRRIIGYHQAPQNRLNIDNAVAPAFRYTLSFLIGTASVQDGDDATQAQLKHAAEELTNDVLKPWRDVAPDSEYGGSYGNEANVVEPDWQQSFYGAHYSRLLELKRKWDPQDVFYATTAVGSERWEVRDGDWGTQTQNGRLCRI